MAEPQHIGKPLSCSRCGAKGQVTITTAVPPAGAEDAISISYLTPGFAGTIEAGRPKIVCGCGAQIWS